MKRTLLVAAISTLAAGAAMAQSTVTIYGRLNTSIERQKDYAVLGESRSVLANNGSRLGFKGLEDLGGGLKAGFTLEHRFNSDNGAATNPAFWGGAGESSVYLMSDSFGMIKAGHYTSEAYFATSDVTDLLNHGTGTSADALYRYLGTDDNKVSYRTPALGPVTAEVGYIFGEGINPKSYDLAINATFGAFGIGLGAEKVDDNIPANARSGDYQVGLRASYSASPITVTGYVQRFKDDASGATSNIGRVSAQYDIGAIELHAAFGMATKLEANGILLEDKHRQYTVGANYNLSKRTKVYAYYDRITNVAVPLPVNSIGKPSAIAVGIRHNF
jgi:predicted porin